MKALFIFGALLCFSMNLQASCFESLDAAIGNPRINKIYSIENRDGRVEYCSTYKVRQYFRTTTLANSADVDLNDADVNTEYADVRGGANVSRYLKSISGTDLGRRLSLLLSLNGIDRITISNNLNAYSGNLLSMASDEDPATQVNTLMQLLRYQYLLSQYIGKEVRVCDSIADYSILDNLFNPLIRDMANNSSNITEVSVCNNDQVYGGILAIDPANSQNYGYAQEDDDVGELSSQ